MVLLPDRGKRFNRFNKIKAVATLIIAPEKITNMAVKNFRKTKEVDSLLSLDFSTMAEDKLHEFVPSYKLRQAKKIYKSARIQPGYLPKFILKKRKDLTKVLLNIPEGYKMICQVECPSKECKKYKNIDVGFTSNGKCEEFDDTLVDCAIRETQEEARITLSKDAFNPLFQAYQRKKINMENLPLTFTYSSTLCYILVL